MALTSGSRVGAYEVIAPLGSGGMGEVYRARDTKLNRDVALKVLPPLFANDPDRLARFEREAQALAALNHPNIAAVYGFDESGGSPLLVLELVEGESLAARLSRGPLPLEEALEVCRQVADALNAAHEKGILHRDLKPGNIILQQARSESAKSRSASASSADGAVRAKVIDFGLAKLMTSDAAGGSLDLTASPTLTTPAGTLAGTMLGTAAYMSPEQARGRAGDARMDIWAFGCVLYETLTAKQAFHGETLPDIFAAIVKSDPDWTLLPPDTPAVVRSLLRQCLKKRAVDRLRDIGDAKVTLDDAISEPESIAVAPRAAVAAPTRSTRWVAPIALASLVLGGGAAWVLKRPSPEPRPIARFEVPPPADASFLVNNNGPMMDVSPDGSQIAFASAPNDGKPSQIWLRAIDAVKARPLPGTEGALAPFWSPDGRSVAFFAANQLKRVDVAGGSPQTVWSRPQGQAAGNTATGTWNQDGVIVFSSAGSNGLQRVSAAGGSPTPLVSPDRSRQEAALLWPRFLPDGRHFIYFAAGGPVEKRAIRLGTLDSQDTNVLMTSEAGADFAPPNYLVFRRGTVLFAQALNLNTFQLEGDPVPIADPAGARTATGRPGFSVSRSGVLAFFPLVSNNDNRLRWFDRNGKPLGEVPLGEVEQAARYMGTDLSPDEKRVAVHIHEIRGGGDIWVLDLERQNRQRLTFDPTQDNSSPIWSPDGSRIAFASRRKGEWGIYVKAANSVGVDELLFQSETPKAPVSWSPDGQTLLFTSTDPKTGADLLLVSVSDRKVTPLLTTPFNEGIGQISPDGRWIAYQSTESGRFEVFVQSLSGLGGKWQVSTAGGLRPRWRKDGRELFFLNGAAIYSSVVERTADGLRFGVPLPVLRQAVDLPAVHNFNHYPYAVTSDGQRFLIESSRLADDADLRAPLTVVLNWQEGLKKASK